MGLSQTTQWFNPVFPRRRFSPVSGEAGEGWCHEPLEVVPPGGAALQIREGLQDGYIGLGTIQLTTWVQMRRVALSHVLRTYLDVSPYSEENLI